MVLRTFGAFDNDAFTVVSSPGGLSTGSPIINNSSTPIDTIFEFSSGFPIQVITLDDLNSAPNDDIFNDDDESNHIITDGGNLVGNGTEVESESYHFVRELDSNGVPFGPEIQITVFSQNGQTSNIWGMSTDTPLNDGAQYIKVDGSNNGSSGYEDFVCFTEGTFLATSRGPRLIETLRVGDKVLTRDNGLQEIRWIGSRHLTAPLSCAAWHLTPVRIKAGSLGEGLPLRDTVYSPNHRILLNDPTLVLISGHYEIFAEAKKLVGKQGITQDPVSQVTYYHMMFDQHEVVLSNEMWSESFLPGPIAVGNLNANQRTELFEVFPELSNTAGLEGFEAARPFANKSELVLWHA